MASVVTWTRGEVPKKIAHCIRCKMVGADEEIRAMKLCPRHDKEIFEETL